MVQCLILVAKDVVFRYLQVPITRIQMKLYTVIVDKMATAQQLSLEPSRMYRKDTS